MWHECGHKENKEAEYKLFGSLIGVPGEIRTHDPQIRNGAKPSSIDYYLVLLSTIEHGDTTFITFIKQDTILSTMLVFASKCFQIY